MDLDLGYLSGGEAQTGARAAPPQQPVTAPPAVDGILRELHGLRKIGYAGLPARVAGLMT